MTDVADQRPSVFALQAACRQVRQSQEFLSIPKVMVALKAATKRARRLNNLVAALPKLQQRLDDYEKKALPEVKAENKEQAARERERERQDAKENPFLPEYQLRRLGLRLDYDLMRVVEADDE